MNTQMTRNVNQTGTITECIRVLEGGETPRRDDAVRELWEYFFADLMSHARRKLLASNASRGSADEEDAAERAFTKICRSIERGQTFDGLDGEGAVREVQSFAQSGGGGGVEREDVDHGGRLDRIESFGGALEAAIGDIGIIKIIAKGELDAGEDEPVGVHERGARIFKQHERPLWRSG